MAQASEHNFSNGTDLHRRMSEGTNKIADKAEQVTDEVKHAAIERVNEVRESTQAGLQQSRDELSQRLLRVGSALRQGGEQLRADDPSAAKYVDIATQRLERAAVYIARTEPRQLMEDAEWFARRQPALFFGGAFLLGLAAGRFLKSTRDGAPSATPDAAPEVG